MIHVHISFEIYVNNCNLYFLEIIKTQRYTLVKNMKTLQNSINYIFKTSEKVTTIWRKGKNNTELQI